MKAIKATGTINDQGLLSLDFPLNITAQSRVEVIVLVPDLEEVDEEETKEAVLEDFRQAWREAMTGQTIPMSQLWDSIDRE